MKLIDLAIKRPVAVMSVVLMTVLLGWLALTKIPIQLTPDTRKPLIIIETNWRGAAPAEIEREIINRQEEVLKGMEGLEKMVSSARRGRGSITLEFEISQSRERQLLLINNRLGQITGMPDEADEPRLKTRDTDDNPVAWFVVKTLPGNNRSVYTYGDYVEDVIQDQLERVPGVALVNVYGGDEQELRAIVDPRKIALYGLTIPEIANALRGTNVNLSAGDVDEGKRRYTVRTESELNTLERINQVVLRSRLDPSTGRIARVTVGDIAEVTYGYKKPSVRIRNLGDNAVVVNTVRDTGTNVIEVMKGIRKVVKELNAGPLPGAGIKLEQVYDETVYINSAISLVTQNIWFGGTLAALILLLFLRSFGATVVISLAIPVSIIGSFVAMAALGRSINVISLAGIAFAVGMVVDAAIVVLENIFRHRQLGKTRSEAAFLGASEVWGAILVSALTTIAVFAPILVMKLVVGQLFRDIAVALSVAVLLSLIVAITVVPALANRLLSDRIADETKRTRLPVVDNFANWFVRAVTGFTRITVGNKFAALGTVVLVCGITGLSTWLFMPQKGYLPEGNRNLILGITVPPPGYNLATMTDIARETEDAVRPHWASETGPESKPGEPPKMDRFWFIAFNSRTILAASAVDPTRAGELVPIMKKVAFREPGTFGFVTQRSLFGRGFGGSNVVDVDITGPDLNQLLAVARKTMGLTFRNMPRSEGNQIRPKPGLELGAPEVRVIPDLLRLADNGLTARDLGMTIDAFNDGLRVAEVTVGSRRIDLTLMGPQDRIDKTQGISNLPVVTRSGLILPVSELARVEVTEGPTEILHLERKRTVSIQIRPSSSVPLEAAIDVIENKIVAELKKQGLPPGVEVSISGTADELSKTWDAMLLNLLVALAVVYLVMAILFESFVYPLIIMFSVPLATAGGVFGLITLNLFSSNPLDMLTLLGFVILIGTVVNNAILLVHQSLLHIRREGMSVTDAINEATRNRIRPIFMSTTTSVCGMLPLVVTPGAGSELYRGLGSVVVGGLALSAVLTLLIIPPLLSLVAGLVEGRRSRRGIAVAQADAAE
jgi:hydrophobic/amphiphilic exporter-1 (mainly G- bacteria), HAE1 family